MTEPERELVFTEAVEEFFVAKKAERVSEHTVRDYTVTLNRFKEFVGPDKLLHEITTMDVRRFLAQYPGSKKNVKNAWIALSSLWTWAVNDGLVPIQILHKVKPPTPEEHVIIPLNNDEFGKLLHEVEHTGRNVERNRAVLLFLLDTGVRASELSNAKIGDIQGNTVKVFGKGAKERTIPMSAKTLRAILDYLSIRRKTTLKSPLFAVKGGRVYERNVLRQWIGKLGDRAGIPNVHPHRIRHTFAVNFLRNGGDAITLQKLLGHSSLDMVKVYVRLAEDDVSTIHRRASPVDNWEIR